jgi:hypothetical protein
MSLYYCGLEGCVFRHLLPPSLRFLPLRHLGREHPSTLGLDPKEVLGSKAPALETGCEEKHGLQEGV